MYIDDVKQSTVSATYTFSDTNEHTVKIVFNQSFTNAFGMFYYCNSLTNLSMAGGLNSSVDVSHMFSGVTTTGMFYYSAEIDYSAIIAVLPSTWTAVAQY